MPITTAILINDTLDLAVVVAVAAVMLHPFRLDRRKHEASVRASAAPLPEDAPRIWPPESVGAERQRDHEGRAAARRRPVGQPASG